MEKQDAHFRHISIVLIPNASQANKKLCAIYENEALKEKQCQNWFAKFCSGDFSFKYAQQSGHPVKVYETHIKSIINSDRHTTTHLLQRSSMCRIYALKKKN